MEKMISVINDNLKSVVNGIKEHKSTTEKLLEDIKKKMDEKINLASDYKDDVENAKKIIEAEEVAISNLEKDLNEIKSKFSSPGFEEILSASNKEINNKINEKKITINKESERIIELTEKAHQLKDDLVTLKQKRLDAESDIANSEVLIKYYEARVNDIINYSNEHTDELTSYIREETPQEDLIANQIDYSKIDLNTIVDGSIFDDIENISDIEIDDATLKKAMSEIEKQKQEEVIEEEVTDEINQVIEEATSIVESIKEEEIQEEVEKQQEETKPTDVSSVEEIKIDDNPSIGTIELNIPDEEEIVEEETSINLEEELKKFNLDITKLSQDDITKLTNNFSSSKLEQFMNMLNDYNIDSNVFYDSIDLYTSYDVTDIDEILGLLKQTNATGKTISLIFKYLNGIDKNALSNLIKSNKDQELTDILYQVLPFEDRKVLDKVLNITKEEEKVLKETASEDIYNKMVMFPEIVIANYNTLNDLKINNIRECLTKHPTRLLYNPENLNDIFDKYETDDLIRCINKNATVLDKL